MVSGGVVLCTELKFEFNVSFYARQRCEFCNVLPVKAWYYVLNSNLSSMDIDAPKFGEIEKRE